MELQSVIISGMVPFVFSRIIRLNPQGSAKLYPYTFAKVKWRAIGVDCITVNNKTAL